ncbi:hypothetical protein NKH77_25960 [Streptomyces sp. M19]
MDGDLDKTLALGTSTKVSYQRGSDAATVLEVATTSVKKGSVSDLDQVPLDAEQRGLQPYYVTMSFKNAGKTNLGYPSLNSAANLRDSRGEEGKRVATLDDDVAACPNKTPTPSRRCGGDAVLGRPAAEERDAVGGAVHGRLREGHGVLEGVLTPTAPRRSA